MKLCIIFTKGVLSNCRMHKRSTLGPDIYLHIYNKTMGQYQYSKQVSSKTTVFHKSVIYFSLSHSFILFLCLSNPGKPGHAKATQLWKISICLSFQSKASCNLILLIFAHHKFLYSESAKKNNSAQNRPFSHIWVCKNQYCTNC